MGSKWFFTVIFDLLEGKDIIFEGGPYFLDSTGLYMYYYKEKFIPEKEDFIRVPIYVKIYSLPTHYWSPSVLKGI